MTNWEEYSQHVIKSLDRIDEDIKALDGKIDKVRMDLVLLKARVAAWAAVTGGATVGGLELFKAIFS